MKRFEEAFRDKVVVLTGAASGIGRETALQLASMNAHLVLGDIQAEPLAGVANECRDRGKRVVEVRTDITKPQDCHKLIDAADSTFGRIDTLINNAGVGMRGRLEDFSDTERLDAVMRVNFSGAMYCTLFALPYLKASSGRLVAVCSLASLTGVPMLSVYSASKHALLGLMDSLRIELRETGVTVTTLFPGFVATSLRYVRPSSEESAEEDNSALASMAAVDCARILLRAAAARKRQVVMTRQGKLGRWLKIAAPWLVDRIAWRSMQRHG